MRAAFTGALLLLTILAAPVAGQERSERSDTARLVDRVDVRDADRALVTRRGDVALILEADTLLIQLTDQGLEEIEAPDADEAAESLATRLLGAMIRAGLRELLDHAIAYPVAEFARAEYVDGRLVLQDHEGEDLFDITVNDRDILTDFREREARAFAREIRQRMQR